MNQVTNKASLQLDGFAGYTPPVVTSGGGAEGSSGSGLPGLKLKFTNETRWIDPEGVDVRALQIAFDVLRRVHEWPGDGGAPLHTITLAPNEPWPDIAALNESCRDQWYEKFGKLVGPWAGEHVVLLFNRDNILQRYWWPSPTSTIGSSIAVRELVEAVSLMRRYRGAQVYPLVELSHKHMNTQFGGRERPHLVIKDWIRLGESGTGALPAPDTPPLAQPDSTSPTAASSAQSVAPLTTKEVVNDEIVF